MLINLNVQPEPSQNQTRGIHVKRGIHQDEGIEMVRNKK